MKLRGTWMLWLRLIIWFAAYLFFFIGTFTLGNDSGMRSFAML